jgi:hypothetical protein
MTVIAAGLVPYAESVRTNSLEQVAQIATLLTASGGRLRAARTQGTVSPIFLPRAPDRNPRTEYACQTGGFLQGGRRRRVYGNPLGRRIGGGGEFGPQMGPDGGRWWQMLGNGAKLDALPSHSTSQGTNPNHAENQRPK